jgi:transforming growth factor-beta-induced protein
MTIAEIAEDAGFSLLLAAVGYIADTNPGSPIIAGLLDSDQYTVFAPTDDAFLNLVAAVESLLDPDILADEGPFAAIDDLLGFGTIEAVVSYHVTEGRRAANSVVPRRNVRTIETMLEGATFSVSTAGMITAVGNTAMIVQPNISASNGIIHVIDAVILPVDLGL